MLAQAASDYAEPPEIGRARSLAKDARDRLDRYMNAIEKGMDPALYVERSRAAQLELAAAEAIIRSYDADLEQPLTDDDLRNLLSRLDSIMRLLDHADAAERRGFYAELGLKLAYARIGEHEKVTASLGVGFFRVGGGT
jgi:chemotaxis regulatin CheY-phosphate phosphatase CheZ